MRRRSTHKDQSEGHSRGRVVTSGRGEFAISATHKRLVSGNFDIDRTGFVLTSADDGHMDTDKQRDRGTVDRGSDLFISQVDLSGLDNGEILGDMENDNVKV